MLPRKIYADLIIKLEEAFSRSVNIKKISPIYGGSVNNTYKLITSEGVFFLKFNSSCDSAMFYKETLGLSLLKNKSAISIPNTICFSESFLVLEYIEESDKKNSFWGAFGKELACIHKNSSDNYGLDYNNFIGPLSQRNTKKENWIDFFIECRLEEMLRKVDSSIEVQKKFNPIFNRLSDFFKIESPSLIHGDLWSGNFICFKNSAYLIDPAVYYGNREVDLAMSRLFGGFHDNFYNAYNEAFPLLPGWQDRFDLYNLYPLLVHLILFGNNYYSQILRILNRYA